MIVQIIDDDSITLKILEAMAKRVPDTVVYCFSSPFEALRWNEKNETDLILVDYTMPQMNGVEFVQKIKSIPELREIPIIMVTGENEKVIRYKALEIGVNDFLNKPVDSTEFITRLRNMLLIRRNQKELAQRADWLYREVKKATREIELREMETIYCLSRATELRDPETGEHIMRMTYYSHHITRNLGLSVELQELILKISPMHDIGKVGLVDSILLKPAKLTEEEFSIMTTHTTIGYNILKDSTSKVLQEAAIIALNHHERYDGTGYPNKLEGEDIPLLSRVVAVADVFDALTSVRPYKNAWEIEDAVKYIKNSSGSHFDPNCVEAFLKNWENVISIKRQYADKK